MPSKQNEAAENLPKFGLNCKGVIAIKWGFLSRAEKTIYAE
jgi:hypothetical protein